MPRYSDPGRPEPTVTVQALIDLAFAQCLQHMQLVAGIDDRAADVLRSRLIREFARHGGKRQALAEDGTLLCDAQRLMRSRGAQRQEIDAVMQRLQRALGIDTNTEVSARAA